MLSDGAELQKVLDPRIWIRGKNENGEIFLRKLRKIEKKKMMRGKNEEKMRKRRKKMWKIKKK